MDHHNQVKVIFLPPNVTSIYQPMDSRVIAMVKKNYWYRLLHMIFETFEERHALREMAKQAKMGAGTMGLNEGHTPHLKDMMDILYTVWDETPASKIKNCWKKSTFVSFTELVSTDDNTSINHQDEELVVDTVDIESEEDDGEEFSGSANAALKIVLLARKFVSKSGSVLDDENELDAAVKEMVETINETNGDQNKMNAMLQGWISMEDNKACVNELAKEVNELMHVDVLLKEMDTEDDHNKSDNETSEEVFIPTPDVVEELVCQLKLISVQVGRFTAEFGKMAEEINEAGNCIRAAYRRIENKRQLRTTTGRQLFIDSFLTSKE
jgi:hypothetical protein